MRLRSLRYVWTLASVPRSGSERFPGLMIFVPLRPNEHYRIPWGLSFSYFVISLFRYFVISLFRFAMILFKSSEVA